ncbi:12613_t:CDS:2, partial [Racocetra persica]
QPIVSTLSPSLLKDLFLGIVHSSSKRTKFGKMSEKKSTKNGWRSAREPMTMNEEEFKRFEALMKAALNTLPITNKEIIAKSKARTKAKREQRKS